MFVLVLFFGVCFNLFADEDSLWKRGVSLGYNSSSGNTDKSQASLKLDLNRKTDDNEFAIKASTFYSSSDDKMDAQKWDALTRYAYSFENKKWYSFYKLTTSHDKFANIDYRATLDTGLGYWFSDTEDFKAMCEVGAGYQKTEYSNDTKALNEPVLVPRAFFEKKIFDNAVISEDFTIYPSLKETGDYRFKSETTFTNKLNGNLSLEFSFIDEYNSNPAKNTKKNDTTFISALKYSF